MYFWQVRTEIDPRHAYAIGHSLEDFTCSSHNVVCKIFRSLGAVLQNCETTSGFC